ncbi:MAG: DUF4199 domain-containing protein [Breznakibacter sp.]|nr:DUF4199 domain-containing protein [Breznakibacter sp.]
MVDLKLLFHNFMKYGAIFGALISVTALGLFFFINPDDFGLGQILFIYLLFSTLPWFVGLYYITKVYRDKELGGYITMPEILQFSLFVGFFGGAIYVFGNLLFLQLVGSDFQIRFFNTLSLKVVSFLEFAKSKQSEIDAVILQFNTIKEQVAKGIDVVGVIMAIVQYSFNAFLSMLIFGWFIRKVKPLFPNEDIEKSEF